MLVQVLSKIKIFLWKLARQTSECTMARCVWALDKEEIPDFIGFVEELGLVKPKQNRREHTRDRNRVGSPFTRLGKDRHQFQEFKLGFSRNCCLRWSRPFPRSLNCGFLKLIRKVRGARRSRPQQKNSWRSNLSTNGGNPTTKHIIWQGVLFMIRLAGVFG